MMGHILARVKEPTDNSQLADAAQPLLGPAAVVRPPGSRGGRPSLVCN